MKNKKIRLKNVNNCTQWYINVQFLYITVHNCKAIGEFDGAPTVSNIFLLMSFSLYITIKSGIAAAGEPIYSE